MNHVCMMTWLDYKVAMPWLEDPNKIQGVEPFDGLPHPSQIVAHTGQKVRSYGGSKLALL